MIKINNLNYSYNNQLLFDNIDLKINTGTFAFISGPTSNGKTTLLKLIAGLIKSDGIESDIEQKEIGFVFENPENYFVADKSSDEITFMLEILIIVKKNKKKDLMK